MTGHSGHGAQGHGMAAAPATHHSGADDPAHTPDCCASGACADCALASALTGPAPGDTGRLFGDSHDAPAPNTVPGRPLAHDPPPPRA